MWASRWQTMEVQINLYFDNFPGQGCPVQTPKPFPGVLDKLRSSTVKLALMVFITQLIYILDNQESVFDQFEAIAIPAIKKYNGRLFLRVRPDKEAYIESNIEKPYEIHLV